jgi:hypothetical protein
MESDLRVDAIIVNVVNVLDVGPAAGHCQKFIFVVVVIGCSILLRSAPTGR